MRAARILVAGARALSAEVCKNIVLAGVGKLVLCDHESVTPADMYGQFLVGESDIGKNVCGSGLISSKTCVILALFTSNIPKTCVILTQFRSSQCPVFSPSFGGELISKSE